MSLLDPRRSYHWCDTMSPMTHCLSSSRDAESGKARSQASVVLALPGLCGQSLHPQQTHDFVLPPTSLFPSQPLRPHSMLAVPSELISATSSLYCHYFPLLVPQSMHKVPHYAVAYGFHQDILIIFWSTL